MTRGGSPIVIVTAARHWNELLVVALAREGFADLRPARGSVLVRLFTENNQRIGALIRHARPAHTDDDQHARPNGARRPHRANA